MGAVGGHVDASLPLGRYAAAGLRVSFLGNFDVALAPRLRAPIYGELGEYYVTLPVGLAIAPKDELQHDPLGLSAGARTGVQFALWPEVAFFFEGGATLRRFGGPTERIELLPGASLGVVAMP